MKKLMIRHTKEELAVAAITIKKCLMQQTTNKIINEELEVNGTEIIGEEEFEYVDENRACKRGTTTPLG